MGLKRFFFFSTISKEIKDLAARGYPIFPDLESKFDNEEFVDEAIEFYRKNTYQPTYYREHPLAEGEEEKPVAFPTFTVNGRTFCTYAIEPSYNLLAGLTINLEEKNPETKEALELLTRIEPLTKRLAAVNGKYGKEDSKKAMVSDIVTAKIQKERDPLVAKLMLLLKDKVPKVKDYMESHPEKFRLK